jgi:DNA-binding NtrC family response regulator
MQQVRKEIGPYVESAASLLFWGETGSGMGFLAQAIHEASGRSGKFLQIPSFSLDEDTAKQQFLGVDDQPGWLEEADKGTIFIKRISEMPINVQQTIQYLLANRSVDGRLQFVRKGQTESVEVNVRFIFSMTHDLNMALHDELLSREAIHEMKRRGGKIVHIPPLRERQEDIPDIVQNFLSIFNQQYHRNVSGIDANVQAIFAKYVWPGNIEELKQVIETIVSQTPDLTMITKEHLPDHIINPEITGDKYRFKFKDDAKFVGKILSPLLRIESESKKLTLNTGDLIEITRIEDKDFAPPRFKHFIFKLKDGSQITGQMFDKKMSVETSFDPFYEIDLQAVDSIYLA